MPLFCPSPAGLTTATACPADTAAFRATDDRTCPRTMLPPPVRLKHMKSPPAAVFGRRVIVPAPGATMVFSPESLLPELQELVVQPMSSGQFWAWPPVNVPRYD